MPRSRKVDMDEYDDHDPFRFLETDSLEPKLAGDGDPEALELGDSRSADRFGRLNDEELFLSN